MNPGLNPLRSLGYTPRAFASLETSQAIKMVEACRTLLLQVIHPDRNSGAVSPINGVTSTAMDTLSSMQAGDALQNLRFSYRFLDERDSSLKIVRDLASRIRDAQDVICDTLVNNLGSNSVVGRSAKINLFPIRVAPLDVLNKDAFDLKTEELIEEESKDPLPPDSFLRNARFLIQESPDGIIFKNWSKMRRKVERSQRESIYTTLLEAVESNDFSKLPEDVRTKVLQGFDPVKNEQFVIEYATASFNSHLRDKGLLENPNSDELADASLDRCQEEQRLYENILDEERNKSIRIALVGSDGQVLDTTNTFKNASIKFVGFLPANWRSLLLEPGVNDSLGITANYQLDPKTKLLIINEVILSSIDASEILQFASVQIPTFPVENNSESMPYLMVKIEEKDRYQYCLLGRVSAVEFID